MLVVGVCLDSSLDPVMLSALRYCLERSVTSRDLATWTSWIRAHLTMGPELQTSDVDIQAQCSRYSQNLRAQISTAYLGCKKS